MGNSSIPDFMQQQKATRQGYVPYGSDNKFPEYLYGLYIDCSIHQSILDNITDYVIGDGIIFNSTIKQSEFEIRELIKKCVLDYKIYGGFAIQIIYNKLGEKARYNYLDFMKVRTNEDMTMFYYSDNFNKYASKIIEIEPFNENSQGKTSQVFYFKNDKSKGVYPIPDYSGGLKAIETLIEIQNYHLNTIRNGFNGSMSITFTNGIPDESIRKDVEKAISDKFTGSNNGGKMIIGFVKNKDEAPIIDTIESQNLHERYQQLEDTTNKNLFIAHRIPPQLIGSIDKSGFNSTEYSGSFKVFNKTVVSSIQQLIINAFNKIGIDFNIEQFNINFGDV